MTSPTRLRELADRVEAAAGPDPRLGAVVEITVNGFPERAYQRHNGMRARGSPDLDRIDFMAGWMAENPTSSLDAAMTLVPEGCTWSWYGSLSRAYVMRGKDEEDPEFQGKNSSPALALTAACLRALSKERGNG